MTAPAFSSIRTSAAGLGGGEVTSAHLAAQRTALETADASTDVRVTDLETSQGQQDTGIAANAAEIALRAATADLAQEIADRLAGDANEAAQRAASIDVEKVAREAADAALDNRIVTLEQLSGYFNGSSDTFATLPSTRRDGKAAQSGDIVGLTAEDGTNPAGIYMHDGAGYQLLMRQDALVIAVLTPGQLSNPSSPVEGLVSSVALTAGRNALRLTEPLFESRDAAHARSVRGDELHDIVVGRHDYVSRNSSQAPVLGRQNIYAAGSAVGAAPAPRKVGDAYSILLGSGWQRFYSPDGAAWDQCIEQRGDTIEIVVNNGRVTLTTELVHALANQSFDIRVSGPVTNSHELYVDNLHALAVTTFTDAPQTILPLLGNAPLSLVSGGLYRVVFNGVNLWTVTQVNGVKPTGEPERPYADNEEISNENQLATFDTSAAVTNNTMPNAVNGRIIRLARIGANLANVHGSGSAQKFRKPGQADSITLNLTESNKIVTVVGRFGFGWEVLT